MPIYEYECSSCGHALEVWQKMGEPQLQVCPKCHKKKLTKVISSTTFHLKGTGWYVTDYAGKKPRGTKKSSEKETLSSSSPTNSSSNSSSSSSSTTPSSSTSSKSSD